MSTTNEQPPEVENDSDNVDTPDRDNKFNTSEEDESEAEPAVDLMVTTRAKRANAGNRMSTLLAKTAEEDEWGEDWEEAPDEEEFLGDEMNEQEDNNMESSSSEDEAEGGDDEEGEKELRKAERQERNKKRKVATNPFTAGAAVAARKRVRLQLPAEASATSDPPPRPKKKSERSSWIPTEEDGPIRMSSRKATMANKASTLAKLKEKDRKRDDTLAVMKAAEARKAKEAPKPLTQAERLAEAARNERINKKTLHRWEEAEEARAAERQAKIDALKNRKISGPFIRFYTGPAIWVDDKIKYVGKEAPSLEHLEEKLNKEPVAASNTHVTQAEGEIVEAASTQQNGVNGTLPSQPPSQEYRENGEKPPTQPYIPTIPIPTPSQPPATTQPWTPASQASGGDVFMGSHGMPYPNSIMFPPPAQDSLLHGIDQYADLPLNHFSQPQSSTPYTTATPTLHSYLSDPILTHIGPAPTSQTLHSQFQPQPAPPPPPPPAHKVIRRALRNLVSLCSFPDLDATSTTATGRVRTTLTHLKDRDRAALIALSSTLFSWTPAEATTFVTAALTASTTKSARGRAAERDAALHRPAPKICAVTNFSARYRDPETGIAYHDTRAFGVLRGVIAGGFTWCEDLGCYVGGRAKPLEGGRGKGFLGMPPAKGVPMRFWEMEIGGGKNTSPKVVSSRASAPASAQSGGGVQTDGVLPAAKGQDGQ